MTVYFLYSLMRNDNLLFISRLETKKCILYKPFFPMYIKNKTLILSEIIWSFVVATQEH